MSVQDGWKEVGLGRPDATDWEEHSAVGDVSTGRRFKAVQIVPNVTIIDDVNGNQSLMYFGFSKPGTATSAALWRIMKLSVSGGVSTFTYADGDDSFNNVWNDRVSLAYS